MLTSPLRSAEVPQAADRDSERRVDGQSLTARRPVRIFVRQCRVVALLAASTAVFAVVAVTAHVVFAWALAALTALLAGGYVAAVARIRSLAVQREMTLAFGAGPRLEGDAWVSLERDLALAADGGTETTIEATPERGAVTTFVLASLLGWVLTPVVALIRLACGDLSDLRRRGILDRLVRAQRYGRSRSLQVLT
ncbi:MAG: hypothetical protein M3063_01045, partial [Actinomycetota bacterium]|nr:hypothetical protein [Actinomycetota bacterium]